MVELLVVVAPFATVISRTASNPLDRIQILRQTQNELVRQRIIEQPYSGMFNVISRTYQTEGIFSFFRGNFLNLARPVPSNVGKFCATHYIGKEFQVNSFVAGSLSGLTTVVLDHPLNFLRIRRICDSKIPINSCQQYRFKTHLDLARHIYQSEGVRGFYTGLWLGLLHSVVQRSLYFGLYDTFISHHQNRKLARPESTHMNSFLLNFVTGWSTSLLAGLIAYPIETVKHRVILTAGSDLKYGNSLACVQQILKNENSNI